MAAGTTKLNLYNSALQICGERILSSIVEPREPRRLLDQAWDTGAVDYCLESGQWNFATRSMKIEYSPSVAPTWGYQRAFDKPVDYVRTVAICADEFFRTPLLSYVDEANFWFANLDVVYVRYVSNDNSYGNDMGKWPRSFQDFVSVYLASQIVTKLSQDANRWEIVNKELKHSRTEAKAIDSMNEPTAFAPPGQWTTSRARRGGSRDRGNRGGNGPLIG